jgi:hypothetical protein
VTGNKIETGVYVFPKSGKRVRIDWVCAPDDNNGAPGCSVKWIGERRPAGFYIGVWSKRHMEQHIYLKHVVFERALTKGGR